METSRQRFSRRFYHAQNIAKWTKWTTPTSKNAVFAAAVANIWGRGQGSGLGAIAPPAPA